jgi:hypothetical protein
LLPIETIGRNLQDEVSSDLIKTASQIQKRNNLKNNEFNTNHNQKKLIQVN